VNVLLFLKSAKRR